MDKMTTSGEKINKKKIILIVVAVCAITVIFVLFSATKYKSIAGKYGITTETGDVDIDDIASILEANDKVELNDFNCTIDKSGSITFPYFELGWFNKLSGTISKCTDDEKNSDGFDYKIKISTDKSNMPDEAYLAIEDDECTIQTVKYKLSGYNDEWEVIFRKNGGVKICDTENNDTSILKKCKRPMYGPVSDLYICDQCKKKYARVYYQNDKEEKCYLCSGCESDYDNSRKEKNNSNTAEYGVCFRCEKRVLKKDMKSTEAGVYYCKSCYYELKELADSLGL